MVITISVVLVVLLIAAAAIFLYLTRSSRDARSKDGRASESIVRDRRRDPGDSMSGSVLAAGVIGTSMYDNDGGDDETGAPTAGGENSDSESEYGSNEGDSSGGSDGSSDGGSSSDGGGGFFDGGGFDGGGGGFDGGGGPF